MTEEFTPREITGADVVREARRYLGVRFRHQGESFEGIDCSGLALAVGRALGQVEPGYKRPAYSLNPDPRLFMREFTTLARLVRKEDACAGDIAVMCHRLESRREQHCAILTNVGLIHIFPASSIRRVAEHSLDELWRAKIICVVRYRGVADGC